MATQQSRRSGDVRCTERDTWSDERFCVVREEGRIYVGHFALGEALKHERCLILNGHGERVRVCR